MNLPTSGLMDVVASASWDADVAGIITLGALPVALTFSTPTGAMAIDRSTGQRTVATDDDDVTGFFAALTSKEVEATPSAITGDSWLLLVKSDLSSTPTVDSWATVTASSTRYTVLTVMDPTVSSHYRLHVRAHA